MKRESFIVVFWYRVFRKLRDITPFWRIERRSKSTTQNPFFTECWVLGCLILVTIMLYLFPFIIEPLVKILLLLVLGGIRTFEIIVNQVNIVFFRESRAENEDLQPTVTGNERLVILVLYNCVEVILWYALGYFTFSNSFNNGVMKLSTISESIRFSFNTFTSFGYAATSPVNWTGRMLTMTESAIGVFVLLIVLAHFVSLLRRPETKDESEREQPKVPDNGAEKRQKLNWFLRYGIRLIKEIKKRR